VCPVVSKHLTGHVEIDANVTGPKYSHGSVRLSSTASVHLTSTITTLTTSCSPTRKVREETFSSLLVRILPCIRVGEAVDRIQNTGRRKQYRKGGSFCFFETQVSRIVTTIVLEYLSKKMSPIRDLDATVAGTEAVL
jgi:hypothetical protein